MVQIRDITVMGDGIFTVVFEENGEREVTIFKNRAMQQDIDALEVYHPARDDPTITLNMNANLAEDVERWAGERGVTSEQIWRAILIYLVKHGAEDWERYGRVEMYWRQEG